MLLQLGLAGGVSLRVTRGGVLEVERPGEAPESLPLAPDLTWPTEVAGCASGSGASALVALVRHDALFLVAAGRRGCLRVALGERIAHSEQLGLFAAGPGFVVLYEHGLVALDEAGRERWRIDRVTFDWRLVDEHDGALWLSDTHGNLLGFDAETGIERT